jgi:hypothetical protein
MIRRRLPAELWQMAIPILAAMTAAEANILYTIFIQTTGSSTYQNNEVT